jgi:alpha-amylase/alpha-mannosidase (GH57 family)
MLFRLERHQNGMLFRLERHQNGITFRFTALQFALKLSPVVAQCLLIESLNPRPN